MITQKTAERIWSCYREMAAARKLLADMDKAAAENCDDKYAERLRDVFGRRQRLQLGVPSGESGHQLFCVEPQLARSIIIAHMAAKHADLIAANEQARIELDVLAKPDVARVEGD